MVLALLSGHPERCLSVKVDPGWEDSADLVELSATSMVGLRTASLEGGGQSRIVLVSRQLTQIVQLGQFSLRWGGFGCWNYQHFHPSDPASH